MFNKKDFENFLLDNKILAHKAEPITLASGKKSSWYVSGRIVSQNLARLNQAAEFVISFMQEAGIDFSGIDAVMGVPEGTTELGNSISRKLIEKGILKDKIYLLRVKQKEHGDPAQRFWINGNVPKKIILLEDTVTTGGSILKIVDKLKESGVEVVCLVYLIDRLQLAEGMTAKEKFDSVGLKFYNITNAQTLLPQVVERIEDKTLREEIRVKINSEYELEYKEINKESPIHL